MWVLDITRAIGFVQIEDCFFFTVWLMKSLLPFLERSIDVRFSGWNLLFIDLVHMPMFPNLHMVDVSTTWESSNSKIMMH